MSTPARRYEPSQARAAAIRQARDWAHMSLQDLATALGVSKTTVRCWESATRDPGPAMAARIAVAARVPVSSLLIPSRSIAPEPSRTAAA
jgi:DNA-binding transcriptional regulator YiaG